ncbi:uncharacterized protein ColSpa_12639 [Colletotrichum spaethianum]|uniref:Uncharacterized protein n=1 Tax=Colletotrichum spaethianum TaxID=700344 RepID=A0AA37UTR9_9PEZI|nr:uncharacterized protein ColSpa_12639 [Colletotrichum spaethianum]GKT52458.1 hypothetical protein ColSpa_12639 [Colletotrichum spaethianum]
MLFTKIAFLGLVYTTGTLAASCRIYGWFSGDSVLDNCCWGKGQKACTNQNRGGTPRGTSAQYCSEQSPSFCENVMLNGKPISETCDADCCSTTTGWGIGCPK